MRLYDCIYCYYRYNLVRFNHIKNFLGEDILFIDFVPQMATKLTAIVIWSDNKYLTTGSVGCAESQREQFIRLVEFNDFFKS